MQRLPPASALASLALVSGCSAEATDHGTGVEPSVAAATDSSSSPDPIVLDQAARSTAMSRVLDSFELTTKDVQSQLAEPRFVAVTELDALATIDGAQPFSPEVTVRVDAARDVVEGLDSEFVGRELYKRWRVHTDVDETAHSVRTLALGYDGRGKLRGFVSMRESGGKVVVESGPYVGSGPLKGLDATGMYVFTRSNKRFDQRKNAFADGTDRDLSVDVRSDSFAMRLFVVRDKTGTVIPMDVNWVNCVGAAIAWVGAAAGTGFSCAVAEVGTAGIATGVCASASVALIGAAVLTVGACTP